MMTKFSQFQNIKPVPGPGDKFVDPEGVIWDVSAVWTDNVVVTNQVSERLIHGCEMDYLVQVESDCWKILTSEERVAFEIEKKRHLEIFQGLLERNFLAAEEYLKNEQLTPHFFRVLVSVKVNFIRQWATGHSRHIPDYEQAEAIGTISGHVLVTARAGSGKTATLVNRALFLLEKCGVSANEMLILAFNRKAATEIRRRLLACLDPEAESEIASTLETKRRGSRFPNQFVKSPDEDSVITSVADSRKVVLPHVMTFHALAYRIVHPGEDLIFDDSSGNQSLSRVVQQIIDERLRDPDFRDQIRDVMLAHFRQDWVRIVEGGYDKDRDFFLEYRRSLVRESLNGEYVKSIGEKLIADFLFEHDVPYKYERNYRWGEVNYKPDFTVFGPGKSIVIIEYFGLQGDPDYDEMSAAKRQFWSQRSDATLLEYSPICISAGGIEGFHSKLERDLRALSIQCRRLTENEIWEKARDRLIDRFTKVIKNYIGRCRKLLIMPAGLQLLIEQHVALSEAESNFNQIALDMYQSYLNRLEAAGQGDFDGLIQQAADKLDCKQTKFHGKTGGGDVGLLRHICVDEFQDFSELFHRFLSAIRAQNPEVEVFCVGDDWQAINGFAGSDLKFFHDFSKYLEDPILLNISTNYRSRQEIVEVGNMLMRGKGRPSVAISNLSGKVEIARIDTFEPSELEKRTFEGDEITPITLRLVKRSLDDGMDVVILSRRNAIPYYFQKSGQRSARGLEVFLDQIQLAFPEQQRERISIATVHSYKGLERQKVIVLDAVDRSYPLIHPDWIFTKVFGDTLEEIVDAERRLFYVALTRAVHELVIITDGKAPSPFLSTLRKETELEEVDWRTYEPYFGAVSHLLIQIGNQAGTGNKGTFEIKDQLKSSGYKWRATGVPSWVKSVAKNGFTYEALVGEVWAARADGIVVLVSDSHDNPVAKYLVSDGKWVCLMDELCDSDTPRF